MLKIKKDKKNFLLNRKNTIGGSDISKLVGSNPWSGLYDLVCDKGTSEIKQFKATPPMKMGTMLEKFILDEWARLNPTLTVKHIDDVIIYNDKFPKSHVSLDGVVAYSGAAFDLDYDNSEELFKQKVHALVEIKFVSTFGDKKWENGVPPMYIDQCQYYMGILGIDKTYVVALRQATAEIETHLVEFDQNYFDFLIDSVKKFYRNLNQNYLNRDLLKKGAFKMVDYDITKVNTTAKEYLDAYIALDSQLSFYKKSKEQYKKEFKAHTGIVLKDMKTALLINKKYKEYYG